MKLSTLHIKKSVLSGLLMAAVIVAPASAHVVVRPGQVATAAYTTFNVSVPNEKQASTIEVRLEIPEGLSAVTPTVKPGWQIETEKAEGATLDDGHTNAPVTSITWSGGVIPEGQRDDFTFSAKTPEAAGEIVWNAYQTYDDGTVVSWDKSEQNQPKKADGSPDFTTDGPFSVTVVEAAAAETDQKTDATNQDDQQPDRAMYTAIAAIIVAFIALILASKPAGKSKK